MRATGTERTLAQGPLTTEYEVSDDAVRRQRYAAVVEPFLDRLLAFAHRRTVCHADAEDAVQDACVRAWIALDDLRDDASAAPWLHQILRNVLVRRYATDARRERLASTATWDDLACAQVPSRDVTPLEALVAAATSETVEGALRRLPEHYATAIELRDLQGLSCRETADALGVPIGTALSRVHRGRQMLARLIGAEYAGKRAGAEWGTPASQMMNDGADMSRSLRRAGPR